MSGKEARSSLAAHTRQRSSMLSISSFLMDRSVRGNERDSHGQRELRQCRESRRVHPLNSVANGADEGGQIHEDECVEDGIVAISVTDSGAGISEVSTAD